MTSKEKMQWVKAVWAVFVVGWPTFTATDAVLTAIDNPHDPVWPWQLLVVMLFVALVTFEHLWPRQWESTMDAWRKSSDEWKALNERLLDGSRDVLRTNRELLGALDKSQDERLDEFLKKHSAPPKPKDELPS